MSGETNRRYPDSPNHNSVQDGLEFQDVVTDTLAEHGLIIQNYGSKQYQLNVGENRQHIEIKLDNRCTETGRLSIEVAEKTAVNRDWVPSGIYRDDSWLYVQGNRTRIWIFFTSFLRSLHRFKDYTEHEEPKDAPTIRAFFLPIADADKYGHCFDVVSRLTN